MAGEYEIIWTVSRDLTGRSHDACAMGAVPVLGAGENHRCVS